MSSIVRWEAPPPRVRTNLKGICHPHVRSRVIAADLRERPGEWALVRIYGTDRTAAGSARSAAAVIARGHNAAYGPAGAFEAVTRTVDGEVRLYARYQPGGEG